MSQKRKVLPTVMSALLLVGLAGCSNAVSPPSTDAVTSPVSSETPTVTPATVTPSALPPWKPVTPIAPVVMSDADAAKLRAKFLAEQVKSYQLVDPPTVALVRWTSYVDWGQTMAQCLQDAGFNIVGAGDSLSAPDGIGPAQMSAYNLAFYTCESMYSLNPRYTQPITADQLGLWYDYSVQWLVPCLASMGYTTTPPPTREAFIAEGLLQNPNWNPSSQANQAAVHSLQQQMLITETCPPNPPNEYMWGG